MVNPRLAGLLSLLVAASVSVAARQSPFIKIHEGHHWIWVARQDQYEKQMADIEALYDYADKAFDRLCEDWGMQPKKPRYYLLVNPQPGGGFAVGDVGEVHQVAGIGSDPCPGIGCSYDAFSNEAHGIKAWWAHILITHEMVNLFTGDIVSPGWPVDWWADHRSPFPYSTAVHIEYALVPNMAVFHDQDGQSDPLVPMFEKLEEQFGWAMFRKAFRTAIDDGVNWDKFGADPSKLRTAYVAAYLQIGAPEDILRILAPVVPDFDTQMVKDVIRAHERWTKMDTTSSRRKELKERFLNGDYASVFADR